MKYTKTIVCFANSRKTAGRCIAGKEWQNGKPGEWVRPISARPTHELSEEERHYEDGRDPQLLDIIQVPCDSPQPLSHQRENHLIDPEHYWVQQGRLSWDKIWDWLDHPAMLWNLGEGSSTGLNNRVRFGQEDGTSLYLIAVENLRLLVGPKAPAYSSKRTVQGEFIYRGETYRIGVTDPVVEQAYLKQANGQYDVPRPVLCISLADLFEDSYGGKYFYKLIPAVLYPGRFG